MGDFETILRQVAIRDDRFITAILTPDPSQPCPSGLDLRTHSLVRLGALIALDAAPPSYMEAIEAATAGGATPSDVAGVLVAVAPVVGVARAVSAAPNLALGLGYDIDDALEDPALR